MYMETSSDSEAYEYAMEHGYKLESVKFTQNGVIAFIEKERTESRDTLAERFDTEDCVVFTQLPSGSRMYLSDTGTTFDCRQAKKFSLEKASTKARIMDKKSVMYKWEYAKVS